MSWHLWVTVMEGHKTVQESNVQFEWFDDSEVCDVGNSENGESLPIEYNNQEITEYSMSRKSLAPRNYHCSISNENYLLEESLNNNNDYDNNRKSLPNIKTTALEIPISTAVNKAITHYCNANFKFI